VETVIGVALAAFTVAEPAPDVPTDWLLATQLIMPFMLSLPRFGQFRVRITLDGNVLKEIPFRVLGATAG
jgi:hypothetical protein